jgi:hypothetical protein
MGPRSSTPPLRLLLAIAPWCRTSCATGTATPNRPRPLARARPCPPWAALDESAVSLATVASGPAAVRPRAARVAVEGQAPRRCAAHCRAAGMPADSPATYRVALSVDGQHDAHTQPALPRSTRADQKPPRWARRRRIGDREARRALSVRPPPRRDQAALYARQPMRRTGASRSDVPPYQPNARHARRPGGGAGQPPRRRLSIRRLSESRSPASHSIRVQWTAVVAAGPAGGA